MIDGKPTIVLSYSGRFQDEVAKPVAEHLEPFGFRTVLVGEEPLPPGIESNPNSKVEWFFHHANMAVFLATPDDRLESGTIHTRQNIIDEHRLGQQLPHLSQRLLVFKATEVTLPSNINPVYTRLPLDDPDWIASKIVEQARTWGVLPGAAVLRADAVPTSSAEGISSTSIPGGDDPAATLEAIEAMRKASDALAGEEINRGSVYRSELAIAGLIADAGGADTLGVHLANSLFAYRHKISLRQRERLLLVRTYLRYAADENVPGVFWIRDLPRRQVIELLSSVVEDAGDPVAQGQALKILGKLGAPASSDKARRLVALSLADDNSTLRWSALDFLRERRENASGILLDNPGLLKQDRHRVSQTVAMLDLPRRPSDVMGRYISDEYVRSPGSRRAL